jgi:hypothetical protein
VTNGDIILRADNDGTGPGAILGGTVLITCGNDCITITSGTLRIRFNPVDYGQTDAEIIDYGLNLTGGGGLDAKAWVFGLGDDKVYDGLLAASVSGLEPDITAAPPPVTLGAVSNALFDTKDVGVEKLITYQSTFSDTVYELFAPFGTAVGTYVTRADITPAALTITANNATKVFGETLVLATSAFTSVGLVAGETIGGVTLTSPGTVATAPVAGNPYAITPSNATPGTFDPGNYSINFVNGTLLISAAAPGTPGSTPGSSLPGLPAAILPGLINPSTSSPYDDASGRDFVSEPPRLAAYVNPETEGAGIKMPAEQLALLTALGRAPLLNEEPPALYMAPVYPPRQDRN